MVEQGKIDLLVIKDPAAVEIIKFLLEENRQLRERIRYLEEKVSRLEKNLMPLLLKNFAGNYPSLLPT